MRIKIKQIAHLFKVFNPKIHEYIKGNMGFDYIYVKSLNYIEEFINKDVNNFDLLDSTWKLTKK